MDRKRVQVTIGNDIEQREMYLDEMSKIQLEGLKDLIESYLFLGEKVQSLDTLQEIIARGEDNIKKGIEKIEEG